MGRASMTKKKKRSEIPLPPDYNLWKRIAEPLRLAWALFMDNEVPALNKVLPLIGIAYLLSPIDLMPDFIPVLGQLDDLGIILITIGLFIMSTSRELREKHLRRIRFGQPYYVRKDADGVVIDVKGQPVPEDAEEDEEADEVGDAEAAAQAEESQTVEEEEPDQAAQSDTRYARRSR
jgi:uncharacterized membrane protein YkvA (DUF1232 family)